MSFRTRRNRGGRRRSFRGGDCPLSALGASTGGRRSRRGGNMFQSAEQSLKRGASRVSATVSEAGRGLQHAVGKVAHKASSLAGGRRSRRGGRRTRRGGISSQMVPWALLAGVLGSSKKHKRKSHRKRR